MSTIQLANEQIHLAKDSEKFLTFKLDENDYGIPILKVNEIIGIVSITPVPKTPNFVKGVINLRGKIIPVMDLRLKFEMEERAYDANTCIIIMNLDVKCIARQIGVIVDIVSEVCNIPASEIEEAPSYSGEQDESFINGVGKIKEKVVMLLDIEKILSESDTHAFIDSTLECSNLLE